MSLTLRARALLSGAAPASAEPDAGPTTARGRRRAASRHRRTRSGTLPASLALLLRFGVPVFVVLVLIAAQGCAFALGADRGGPLSAPVTLVAVLLLPPAIVAAARLIGVSTLGAVAAAAFATIASTSLRAAGTGFPEHLAVLALLAALAVSARTYRSPRSRLLAAVAVGALSAAALIASPLALASLPFLGWQLQRAARPARRRNAPRTVLAAGLASMLVIAVGLLLGLAQPADSGAAAFGALREWVLTDPVRLAVGLASAAVALRARRMRPLALAILALIVFAQLPRLTDPLPALVLVAPGLALLIGAALDRSLVALGGRERRPRLLGVAGVAVAAMALLTSTGGWGVAVSQQGASAGQASVDPESPVRDHGTASGEAAPPSGEPAPSGAPTQPQERLQRAQYGEQLLRNPRLDASAEAAQLLAGGDVDQRIAIVLGQLLADHDLTVADFPAAGEEEGARRQLLVTSMDGEELATGGASIPSLSAYLSGLSGEFAVESVTVDENGVLATFPPDQIDAE